MPKIAGYRELTADEISVMNELKKAEASFLKIIDDLPKSLPATNLRWLAIARTDIETGFMAMNRAVSRPDAVKPNPSKSD